MVIDQIENFVDKNVVRLVEEEHDIVVLFKPILIEIENSIHDYLDFVVAIVLIVVEMVVISKAVPLNFYLEGTFEDKAKVEDLVREQQNLILVLVVC